MRPDIKHERRSSRPAHPNATQHFGESNACGSLIDQQAPFAPVLESPACLRQRRAAGSRANRQRPPTTRSRRHDAVLRRQPVAPFICRIPAGPSSWLCILVIAPNAASESHRSPRTARSAALTSTRAAGGQERWCAGVRENHLHGSKGRRREGSPGRPPPARPLPQDNLTARQLS